MYVSTPSLEYKKMILNILFCILKKTWHYLNILRITISYTCINQVACVPCDFHGCICNHRLTRSWNFLSRAVVSSSRLQHSLKQTCRRLGTRCKSGNLRSPLLPYRISVVNWCNWSNPFSSRIKPGKLGRDKIDKELKGSSRLKLKMAESSKSGNTIERSRQTQRPLRFLSVDIALNILYRTVIDILRE